MRSLCRLPVAKNHNFGQILTFWGSCTDRFFTDEGQMWCAIADPRSTLTCQISFRWIYSVVVWRRKTPNFCDFFGFQHLVLSLIGNSLTKLNNDAQLQNFPYPKASKSFLYTNAFMAKSGAQSLTFKSVTKKQTDKQANKQTNSTFLATPAAGEIQAPPNLAW